MGSEITQKSTSGTQKERLRKKIKAKE
jgi:hypothetical protein